MSSDDDDWDLFGSGADGESIAPPAPAVASTTTTQTTSGHTRAQFHGGLTRQKSLKLENLDKTNASNLFSCDTNGVESERNDQALRTEASPLQKAPGNGSPPRSLPPSAMASVILGNNGSNSRSSSPIRASETDKPYSANISRMVAETKQQAITTASAPVPSKTVQISKPAVYERSAPELEPKVNLASASKFLPGEKYVGHIPCKFLLSIRGRGGEDGKLVITNYRIFFEPSSKNSFHNHQLLHAIEGAPMATICKVSYPQDRTLQSSSQGVSLVPSQVQVDFRDLRQWVVKGEAGRIMKALTQQLYFPSPAHLFAFAKGNRQTTLEADQMELKGHFIYDLVEDVARMGVDLSSQETYRLSRVNENYRMCATYPKLLVVPAPMTDESLMQVAAFRSKGRIPLLCWVHSNSASIWRCSQPKRGILSKSSSHDEMMLQRIIGTNSRWHNLVIVDCRPELNARVNNLTGGGTESSSLGYAKVNYMNIQNIHAMRESLESIREMVVSGNTNSDINFSGRYESTKWIEHIRLVMFAAFFVAEAVDHKGMTALVHCSDGWDRTGQVCALAQMLLDQHYRTITGLMQVIEKEWVVVGHKFNDRIGICSTDSSQVSPIFLQFLDCVSQLLRLFPVWFEFTEELLLLIADSLYSGRFGTFLFNCDRERHNMNWQHSTPSLWRYVNENRSRFENPLFRKHGDGPGCPLLPSAASVIRNMTPWTNYFFRYSKVPTVPPACPVPPVYFKDEWTQNINAVEDLYEGARAMQARIKELENEVSQLKAVNQNV